MYLPYMYNIYVIALRNLNLQGKFISFTEDTAEKPQFKTQRLTCVLCKIIKWFLKND